ncbi:acyl-CoA dehydrogenase family protein [Actinomadura rubrisoli]|uniref:Acyl-CoA dehydrogenase/oxidase C-terminal domain-containing protein n=1 Tax=Actinomadura rubrisoli TaxID=2530368 RepID=A0A4R5CCH4_9ACTN|nr:acyl-CoA dehydrogenase family protein [Actinomadura rubrisoli]TDD94822.1 hypothetical protein E1298_06115 [Actinomadura rubrisoli]
MASPERARAAARADGLAAGLRCMLGAGRPVPCSARGRAVLPSGWAEAVPAWRFPGRAGTREAARIRRLPHRLAAAEDLELVEVTAAGDTPAAASPDGGGLESGGPAGGGLDAAAALDLAGVRIGVAEAALDRATAYLGERLSDGSQLIRRQLVQGSVADAATELELCAADRSGSADVHRRLSEVEWSIACLFGGGGYLLDGPARPLHLARLVADTWAAPADPGRWG